MAGFFGMTAIGADFDGSEQLMCSFGEVVECDAGAGENAGFVIFGACTPIQEKLTASYAPEISKAEISKTNLIIFLIILNSPSLSNFLFPNLISDI